MRTAASEKSGAAAIFYLSAKKRDISFKFPGAQTEFCYPVPVFTDNWGKLFKNPGSFVFSGNSYTMIYLLLSDDIFPGVFHKFNFGQVIVGGSDPGFGAVAGDSDAGTVCFF